jgi:hypothetical protein
MRRCRVCPRARAHRSRARAHTAGLGGGGVFMTGFNVPTTFGPWLDSQMALGPWNGEGTRLLGHHAQRGLACRHGSAGARVDGHRCCPASIGSHDVCVCVCVHITRPLRPASSPPQWLWS